MSTKKKSIETDCSQLKVIYNPVTLSTPLNGSETTWAFLKQIWDTELLNIQEQVYILFLNNRNEVISWKLLNTGTCEATLFDIKFAVACALGCLASKVIIAHNHPSGNSVPSGQDITITRQFNGACKLINVTVTDHLIFTSKSYFSFVDNDINFG